MVQLYKYYASQTTSFKAIVHYQSIQRTCIKIYLSYSDFWGGIVIYTYQRAKLNSDKSPNKQEMQWPKFRSDISIDPDFKIYLSMKALIMNSKLYQRTLLLWPTWKMRFKLAWTAAYETTTLLSARYS